MISKMVLRTKRKGRIIPAIGELKRINGILYVLCRSQNATGDYLVRNGRQLTEWREVIEEETESHSVQKQE